MSDAHDNSSRMNCLCMLPSCLVCFPHPPPTREFAPSQIWMDEIPFVGTFDHLEAEVTASVIVKALALRGDVWRVIECRELAEVFEQLTAVEGMWRKLFSNPFVNVDMHDLVKRGFAEWRNDGKAIEFTDKGRDRMKKWMIP